MKSYEKTLTFLLAGECRHPDHVWAYATEFIPRVTGDYSGRQDIVFDSLKNAIACRQVATAHTCNRLRVARFAAGCPGFTGQ